MSGSALFPTLKLLTIPKNPGYPGSTFLASPFATRYKDLIYKLLDWMAFSVVVNTRERNFHDDLSSPTGPPTKSQPQNPEVNSIIFVSSPPLGLVPVNHV